MGNLGYYIREGFDGLRRGGVGSAGAVFTVVLSILVIGVVLLVVHNLQLLVEEARSEVEVEAYIAGDPTPMELSHIEDTIVGLPGVGATRYVSKEGALEELRAMLGEDSYLLTEIEENPLPASFRITMIPDYRTEERLAQIAEQLELIPGVTRVSYGREWVESLSEIVRIAGIGGLVIGGVLALASILVVGNAVALGVYMRRDEITILKVVGASHGFIRRPFVIEGLLVGVLGGAIGVGLLYLLYATVGKLAGASDFIPWEWWSGLVGLGAVVGIIGSFFAAAGHVRRAK
ncbi:ABC transporter permease [bacterium]|nr:ABC transporter permease [bacterium]